MNVRAAHFIYLLCPFQWDLRPLLISPGLSGFAWLNILHHIRVKLFQDDKHNVSSSEFQVCSSDRCLKDGIRQILLSELLNGFGNLHDPMDSHFPQILTQTAIHLFTLQTFTEQFSDTNFSEIKHPLSKLSDWIALWFFSKRKIIHSTWEGTQQCLVTMEAHFNKLKR